MAGDNEDYWTYQHDHVRIEAFRERAQYEYPTRPQDRAARREDHHAHSEALIEQLTAALGPVPADGQDNRIAIQGHKRGVLIELDTQPPRSARSGPSKTPALDYGPQGIEVLRSARLEDRTERAVVFVPDDARGFLSDRIAAYGQALGNKKKRPDVERFEPIETIRAAPSRTLFVGVVDFEDPQPQWWELWVREPGNHQARAYAVAQVATNAEIDVHPERLVFPDTVVLFVHASASDLAQALDRMPGAAAEVRKATGNVEPFLELAADAVGQQEWVADLAARLQAPPEDAPAICVIDSGVSAAHPLIAPALAGSWTVDAAWGSDDHIGHGGHGTPMAGGALHGDLFWRMQDAGPAPLTHHVESVKFLPPNGFPPNQPPTYGLKTQDAVAIAEIARPNVPRSFCIATSTAEFAADSPSSWSGAIDQIASGSIPGERDVARPATEHPKRLVLVASGNTPEGTRAVVEQHHSVEDPSQSWNALTIGGYTTKVQADDPGLVPLAQANERSPFSRGSQNLAGDLTPIKPEVLFEAGNMLVDNANFCAWNPAVSLLGTGSNVAAEPLVPFWATSAATAVAGNFLGQLKAAVPGLWAETYRALVVHSAEWPSPIRSKLIGRGAHWKKGGKAAKQLLLRDVGFGVPNLQRAIASARSDVTLLAEAEIQPFAPGQANTAVFNDMHFYRLPWPRAALQALENTIVTMKATLSYFIEPNLSGRAATRPDTYRSFGLRFELKKRLETPEDFRKRLSRLEEAPGDDTLAAEADAEMEEEGGENQKETSYWLLGPKAVQAGSLHCDLWRGHAVDLATHDHIAIFPVGGWWKTHLGKKRVEDKARYALALSITAEADVDLLAEIAAEVEARAAVPVEAVDVAVPG